MFQTWNLVDFENAGNLNHGNPNRAKKPVISFKPACTGTDVAHGNSLALASTITNQNRHLSTNDPPYRFMFLRGIDQTLESRAIDFFFATQVFRESDSIRGYYEYLPAFIKNKPVNERLSNSLRAVALAVYALNCQDRNVLHKARLYYGQAIKLINEAMSSTTEAAKDSTVISILLLGTFENVTSESTRSLRSTKAHTLGVMIILNMRGPQQFEFLHRLQIFQQICTCLHFACVMCSLHIPPELINLRRSSATYFDTNDPSWKLSDTMERVAEFRANVKNCFQKDVGNIVETALKIDNDLTSIANNMPNSWLFQRKLSDSNSNLAFGTYYHSYPDLWIASTWNSLRTCRLLLHQEIFNHFEKFPLLFTSRSISDSHISRAVLHEIIDEICAAIPQFCEGLAMPLDHAESPALPVKNGIPTTAAVYYLMWPIMNMNDLICSDAQREWIVNRVRCIGKSAGIRQAFVVAEFLESNKSIVF